MRGGELVAKLIALSSDSLFHTVGVMFSMWRATSVFRHAAVKSAQARFVTAGKTHKGARARFRINDKNDKLIERMRRGKNHYNLSKSNSRLSRLRQPTVVSKADYRGIKRLLGK